ncbi:unnamed protein product [Pedinophyceae sp. YPF-701]|nr:unnamed protein product [Pedinophyceae sp. YPF-701]
MTEQAAAAQGEGPAPGEGTTAGPERQPQELCSVCSEVVSKYRCPRCSVRTCSLACVKRHKEETGCTGKRDRTAFVKVSDFTDNHLLSDLRFIEEGQIEVDNAKRRKAAPTPTNLPHHLATLKHQARLRGTELLFQQPGMLKRKRNSTNYNGKKRAIFWRVELDFLSADHTATTSRAPETTTLADVAARHLQPAPGKSAERHSLRWYAEAGAQSLAFVMKLPRRPANDPAWWRLPPNVPLAEALRGACVIEYPEIAVLLPGEAETGVVGAGSREGQQLRILDKPRWGPHGIVPAPPPPRPPGAPPPETDEGGAAVQSAQGGSGGAATEPDRVQGEAPGHAS